MNLVILILLAFFAQRIQAVLTGTLSANPTLAQATSTLTFEVQLTQQIPAGGKIVLTFESGFDLTQSSGLTCSNVYALKLSGCTANLNQITINGAQSEDYLIIFNLEKVVLPDYVYSFFVQVESQDSSGSRLEQSSSTGFTLTTEPNKLTATLEPASDIVGQYTDLSITLTSQQTIKASGYIELKLPKWNAGTQQISLAQSFFQTAQLTPILTNTFQIPCKTPSHPYLRCKLTVEKPATSDLISQTFDVLRIDSFALDFTSIVVETSGKLFRNPPSTKVINSFSATAYLQSGTLTAVADKIRLQVTTPYEISANDVQCTAQDQAINMVTPYEFQIKAPLPGPVGLRIVIKIPSQIRVHSLQDASQIVLTSAAGSSPIAQIPYITFLDSSQTTQSTHLSTCQSQDCVQLSLLVPSSSYYVNEGDFIIFKLFDLVNAQSISQSESFELAFYEFDDIIMKITKGVTVTATPGSLQNVLVQPEGVRVREKVPYLFSFVTQNTVNAQSQIKIVLPAAIAVESQNLSKPDSLQNINEGSNISIQYNKQEHSLVIKNAFAQSFNMPTLFEFKINTGLRNAESTEKIGSFQFFTLDSTGAQIDSGSSKTLQFTPNEIKSISVESCSDLQRASETEDICTYSLLFNMDQYPIMSGSVIEIELPLDLSLSSIAATISLSSTQNIGDNSALFSVKKGAQNQQIVRVEDAFLQSSNNELPSWKLDTFAVNIASVVSPRTTAPTLSFKASISSASGYLQYQRLQGVYANVFQARPFQKALIKNSNQTNGADTGVYNFTLQFASQVNRNEYIKITPPASVLIQPGGVGQCQGLSLLSSQLACSILDNSLYVMIEPADSRKGYFNAGEIVSFQVSDIRNPLSLEPTSSFEVYVTTSTSQNYFINQLKQGLSMVNMFAGQLADVRVLPDSNEFFAITDYSIYFVTTNVLKPKAKIVITWPSEFYSFNGRVQCNAIKNIQKSLICEATSSNVIEITKGYESESLTGGTEVGIRFSNIQNPTQSVSNKVINEFFSIETISVDGYAVDRSYQLDFSIGCTYPCLSCDTVQTKCTSCQSLSDGTPLFLNQNQCIPECPISTFANADNICEQCDPLCKRCSKSPDFCDSCRSDTGFPYVTQNGKCTATCLEGTYLDQSNNRCVKCEGNCDNCDSAINCLSCRPGYFFIEGQCLSDCPSNSIQFDSVEVQECLMCESPCASCEKEVTKCTSCIPGTFLHNEKCLDKCPPTYLPNENNVCYKASQTTVPFVSLIMPLMILVIDLISFHCYTRDTHVYAVFMALQSAAMVLFWIYWLVFLLLDGHYASSTLVTIAIFFNYVINYLWWEFYNDKLIKNDERYRQYTLRYPKATQWIKITSLLLCFDLFRLSFSYLFNRAYLKADMLKKDKNYKRINRYELFQLTFCYFLTFVAAIYNLFYTWYGRQVFWIDIECIFVTVLMATFKLVVIFRNEKHYIKTKSPQLIDDGQNLDDVTKKHAIQIGNACTDVNIQKTRDGIRNLSMTQRALAMKALFHKIFTGQKYGSLSQQQINTIGQKEHYLFKHGAQFDLKKERLEPVVKSSPTKYKKVDETNITGHGMNTTEMNDDGPLHTIQIKNETEPDQTPDELYDEQSLINFQSAPLNAQSALQNNQNLEKRHQAFQEELKNRKDPTFDKKRKKNHKRTSSMDEEINRVSQKNQTSAINLLQSVPNDSDDQFEDFTSEKWGPGASKVVADHYNSQMKKTRSPNNLTHQEFSDKIEEVKHCQLQKRLAKEKAFEFEQSVNKLDRQLSTQQRENQKLRDFIKNLELQIAQEQGRLSGVKQQKREEVEFEGTAFYTSNEEGMGLSPNNFNSQNRPAKRRSKDKDRAVKREQPLNIEQIQLEDQVQNSSNSPKRKDRIKLAASPDSPNQTSQQDPSKKTSVQDNPPLGAVSKKSSHPQNMDTKQTSKKSSVQESIRKPSQQAISSNKNSLDNSKKNYQEDPNKQESIAPQSSVESAAHPNDSLGLAASKNRKVKGIPRQNSAEQEWDQSLAKQSSHLNSVEDSKSKINKSSVGKKPHEQRAHSRSKQSLQHKPINKEKEKYEYYTSEDEFGLPVNKLRKKVPLNKSLSKSSEAEFYTSVDKEGQPVQKMRKKANRASSQNTAQRQQRLHNAMPDQSTVKKNAELRHNLQSESHRSRSQIVQQQHRTASRDGGSQVTQSQVTTARAQQQQQERNTPTLRNAGTTVVQKPQPLPKKNRMRKVHSTQRDFSGPYFNHTNFEKAVIATNGRAPYNNREVEIISGQRHFDPNEYQYMRNANQTVVHERVGQGVVSQVGQQILNQNRSSPLDDSASVTAHTVFQGRGQDQSLIEGDPTQQDCRQTNTDMIGGTTKADNTFNESPTKP